MASPRASSLGSTLPSSMSPFERARRLRAMFDAHHDFVWRSLSGLGVSPGALDDGTQQVFFRAHQQIDLITRGSERPFLFRLAATVASNLPRTGPEEGAARGAARDLLFEALASLPGDLRMAFVLFELEEMEIADVAASLEISVGTVVSRVRGAQEKFLVALKRVRKLRPRGDGGAP
jgi:RNA polymerase sigma-70 factor (ECF subfamily)